MMVSLELVFVKMVELMFLRMAELMVRLVSVDFFGKLVLDFVPEIAFGGFSGDELA